MGALIEGDPAGQAATREALERTAEPESSELDIDDARRRAAIRVRGARGARAPRPPSSRRITARRRMHFRPRPCLGAQSLDCAGRIPAEHLLRARLGVQVAPRVRPKDHRASHARARAFAYRGKAQRVAGDFEAAAADFALSRRALGAGTGNPLLRSLLERFRGHLDLDRSRLQHARRRYASALNLSLSVGDSHGVACTDLAVAVVDLYDHQVKCALSTFVRLEQYFVASGDSTRARAARGNRLSAYIALGAPYGSPGPL